ncbi:MAG TPA: VIT1/CCC1 transporter family protein [Anaerolineales bacterium]|nr:VIT1/CCC1 transporter family protein [Anaerolineales bacterium]
MDKKMQSMLLASLVDERNGAFLYDALSKAEKDERLAEVYHRMADAERKHAAAWTKRLKEAGVSIPAEKIGWRTVVLAWCARRFGPNSVLPTITGLEQKDSRKYDATPGASDMAADERSHARLLQQAAGTMKGGMQGVALAQLEGRHRAGGGNALRAAVLGANDGLVSNLSLVMGVAGAEMNNQSILVTGFAGLLAGAFSMALGEWLSVQSSRELYQHQIAIEKAEILASPAEEEAELALIYEARGLHLDEARRLAAQISHDPTATLETLAREELNVDPAELGGSAWVAALTSFFLFSVGAIIPVLPFVFMRGNQAVTGSLGFSAIGLFIIGAGITLFTGRNVFYSGFRQVLFGMVAAVVTFGIGRLIGVKLGG